MDREVYISPTDGQMSFDQVFENIAEYIHEDNESNYRILVGTDSRVGRERTKFVTAIIVHRISKGARYFYCITYTRHKMSLKERMWREATLSLAEAMRLKERMLALGRIPQIEIHIDIGEVGETKALIKELMGLIVSSGFHASYKPDSLAASSVADRHTGISED